MIWNCDIEALIIEALIYADCQVAVVSTATRSVSHSWQAAAGLNSRALGFYEHTPPIDDTGGPFNVGRS